MIKLTSSGRPIWINPRHVMWVQLNQNDTTIVIFRGAEENYLYVDESPEQVVDLIVGTDLMMTNYANPSYTKAEREYILKGIVKSAGLEANFK